MEIPISLCEGRSNRDLLDASLCFDRLLGQFADVLGENVALSL